MNQILSAAEGMYPPDQIPAKIKDLKIESSDLYKPDGSGIAGAVLLFGGGTGSFVSPQGLVLTNHHVAFSAIQRNSVREKNFLENGFYARTLAEELRAPGYEAALLIGYEDITDEVLSAITPQMTPAGRTKAVNHKMAEIEAQSEDINNGLEGRVVAMFNGASYYLYKYMKFKDIRLVYAPPQAIGNFGGETDNWMWPRHTGDFSFMRVYCAPDGKPAEYSEKNVPYKPKVFLPISTTGLNPGEMVFIFGFPGRTYRNVTSFSIANNQNLYYPVRIRIFEDIIRELEDEGSQDPAVELLLASRLKGFYNSLKNNRGLIAGLKSGNLLARKQAQESDLQKQISRRPEWQEKYDAILPAIQRIYDEYYAGYERDIYVDYLRYITVLADALTIEKWSREKVKPARARESGFYDYQIARTKRNFKIKRIGYYAPADARILKMMLTRLAAFPLDDRPAFLHAIIKDKTAEETVASITAYVDNIFLNTRLTNADECLKMFDLSAVQIADLKDPLLELADAVNQEKERLKQKREKFDGEMLILEPQYFAAMKEVKGHPILPDANRSLRFTYGRVTGYRSRDAVNYQPQTTLTGVLEKNTGAEPFNVPQKLIDLANRQDYGRWIDQELRDVPVAFLSTCDITGGNSGSPVLNARGEIVGSAFDGNWEALANDWQYNPALTRTISVDILYVLFILDKFSDADELIGELDLR